MKKYRAIPTENSVNKPVCQLGWACPCLSYRICFECLPVWTKIKLSKTQKKFQVFQLRWVVFYSWHLDAEQCGPGQSSDERWDVNSGLFTDQVLLVRIGLKTERTELSHKGNKNDSTIILGTVCWNYYTSYKHWQYIPSSILSPVKWVFRR